ncbi:MAG: DUF1080 domain-containing protein [Chitinophagaceae bacterium]
MTSIHRSAITRPLTIILVTITISIATSAQTAISLNDLSFFKTPGKSWSIVGDVTGDLNKEEVMTSTPGTGILLNLPVNKNGADLYTQSEFGDVDLEMDYNMAKNSNSGIYLQGRYEFQLLDSWTVKNPTYGDNGGVYERWDDKRPDGAKGYEGYAPRQNVSRAPGLWQHVKISFQAPRFLANGQKIENAKMLRVELNGVLIHENVEMLAPTRGGGDVEKPLGPLRLQGDHGTVAFRNIKITNFDKPRPSVSDLKYAVYKGRYNEDKDVSKLPSDVQGSLVKLTASTINNLPNEYFIKYTGTIRINDAGEYSFRVEVPGGRGILKINGQAVGNGLNNDINLSAGNVPFELIYAKEEDWKNRSLGLLITGPGIRPFIIGDSAISEGSTDPIYVDAPVNTILRSFMNISQGVKSVHAVNVGSPDKIHYTYDLDFGNIIQVWRGGFLEATPMWHDRGDGTSRPVGAVIRFGKPALSLSKLATPQSAWPKDTTNSGFRARGYKLDKRDVPTFLYQLDSSMVEDAITSTGEGQGFRRDIIVKKASPNLYARLAEGASIQVLENNMYLIDSKAYYLRIDDAGGAQATVRDNDGRKELVIPVQNKLSYSILY